MSFPPQGLVYDYVLDDGGIFLNEEENKDENEEEVKKVKAVKIFNFLKINLILLSYFSQKKDSMEKLDDQFATAKPDFGY